MVIIRMSGGVTEAPFTILDNNEAAVLQMEGGVAGAAADMNAIGGWFLSDITSIMDPDDSSIPA